MEGENLNEDTISEYFTDNFKGDCLLAVGDDETIKIHFHTNEPWRVLEYCDGKEKFVQQLEKEALSWKGRQSSSQYINSRGVCIIKIWRVRKCSHRQN